MITAIQKNTPITAAATQQALRQGYTVARPIVATAAEWCLLAVVQLSIDAYDSGQIVRAWWERRGRDQALAAAAVVFMIVAIAAALAYSAGFYARQLWERYSPAAATTLRVYGPVAAQFALAGAMLLGAALVYAGALVVRLTAVDFVAGVEAVLGLLE